MKYRSLFVAGCAALALSGCQETLDLGANAPSLGTDGPIVVNSAEEAMPNIVLVKFDESYIDEIENKGLATRSMGASARSGISDFDKFLSDVNVTSFQRLFPVGKFEKRTREKGMHLWYKVEFSSDKSMTEVEKELCRIKELQVVQFNMPVKPIEPTTITPFNQMTRLTASTGLGKMAAPTDPLFANQWNMDYDVEANGPLWGKYSEVADINFLAAWDIQQDASDVIVAVIDQGVNYNHPDLAANMWVNEAETTQGGEEDLDGNGYAGDRYGYDFAVNSSKITINTHGTHVAGTIAARNNNEGVVGIAGGSAVRKGAKIMTCSIFSETGSGGTTAVAEAVKYAADNGAVICQNSWGYTSTTIDWENAMIYSAERQAYDYFIEFAGKDEDGNVVGPMNGGLVTFAAGNNGHMYGDAKMYPAAYAPFLTVGSVGADFRPAYYTDYGDWVDISAPGGDQLFASVELEDSMDYSVEYDMWGGVLSTYFEPGNTSDYKYAYMQGTSMACPQVSGVAALAIQHAKDNGVILTPSELRELIIDAATPIDSYFKGTKSDDGSYTGVKFDLNMEDYKGKMGAGLLNAGAVLANVAKRVGAPIDHVKPATPNVTRAEGDNEPGSITIDWNVEDGVELYRLYISTSEIKTTSDGNVKYDNNLDGPFYVTPEEGKNTLSYTFEGLRAEKEYKVAVVAVDNYRFQSEVKNFTFKTGVPKPGPAVKDFTIGEVGAGNVNLSWTEVGDCVGDLYVSYVITFATDANFENVVLSKTVLAKEVGKTMNVSVSELLPDTHYYVKVQAWDNYYFESAAVTGEFTTTSNNMPVIAPGTVENQELQYWETKTLTFNITDADKDTWTPTFEDKAECWTMTYDSEQVTLTFNGPVSFVGNSEATLTVTDAKGGKASVKIPYTVIANIAPEQTKVIKDIYISEWNKAYKLDLNQYFTDENDEKLNFSYSLKGKSVTLSVDENKVLNIVGQKNGLTEVTLTATDAQGKSVFTKFDVMVRQSDYDLEVYPNPVVNEMNLRMGENVKGDIQIKVVTTNGALVYQTTAKIDPFAPANVDVSTLKAGSYIVEVTYNGVTYKNNIVKL